MAESHLFFGCLLAALLGAFGQSLRAVAGLKKQSDAVNAAGKGLSDVFNRTTFFISIFIGVVAGIAGYLGLAFASKGGADFAQGITILGVIAAGYAGADFVEAFAKKYLPK